MQEKEKKYKGSKYFDEEDTIDPNPEEQPRSEMDAADGNDPIEMEDNEDRKYHESNDYLKEDGDLGETDDIDDLPFEKRQQSNRYDPGLSTGTPSQHEKDELERGIRIKNEYQAGMAYGEDDYVEDKDSERRENKKKK